MTSVTIPLPRELMLPALRAVIELGGSARYQEIDEKALDLADITQDQRSVHYDEGSTASGSKVLQRLGWSRSMLKRIGALESAGKGVWSVTEYGRQLASKSEDAAEAEIDAAVKAGYERVSPSSEMLATLADEATLGAPREMAIGELVQLWGVNRRPSSTVDRIRADLRNAGLRTEPDFTQGSLSTLVRLVIVDSEATSPKIKVVVDDDESASFLVGNIPSANAGVTFVTPEDTLLKAQAIMRANDFSQLAVMTGKHTVTGAVSWESIAKTTAFKSEPLLIACIDPDPTIVRLEDRLLDVVPDISGAGFVFVRDAHNKVCGIITASDLADQFALLTRPFLMVGQIELLVRRAVNRSFTTEQLLEVVNPDDDRDIDGAESLTLGEIQRLLEEGENFEHLGWKTDRKVFLEHFDRVRRIRNEVMHFSPDPIAESDLRTLKNFLKYVAELDDQWVA